MEYNNNRLRELLKKYLAEDLNAQERIEFSALLEQLEPQQLYDVYDEIDTPDPFFEDVEANYDHERVLHAIRQEISSDSKPSYRFAWTAVAIVAVVLLFFISRNLLVKPTKTDGPFLAKQVGASIPALDSNAVSLSLADGKVIDWKQHDRSSYYKNGYQIDLMQDGGVRYSIDHDVWTTGRKSIGENTFSTKRGATSNIILEDGTRVWLNSGSSLKFPTSFRGQPHRIVKIVGEAYFEVAHNSQQPFVVISNYSKTTVLGTKFNIKAYPNQQPVQTTLLQGSVLINSLHASSVLVPGAQATVSESGKISVTRVNVEDFIAWKNGLIHFDNLSIEEIVRELSHWYDIASIENMSSNQEHYTGTINRGKRIDEVLSHLERISNTKLTIRERRVMIRD